MFYLIQLIITALCWQVYITPSHAAFVQQPPVIEKQVIVLRHSVRAPTQDSATLALWSQQQWPQWPVAPGHVTPRGEQLATAFGAGLRKQMLTHELLRADTCPQTQDIVIHADTMQRTRVTAQALAQGLAPQCILPIRTSKRKADPLFNPVQAGLTVYDPALVTTQISEQELTALQLRLMPQLAALNDLINGVSPKLCRKFALDNDCSLPTIPTQLNSGTATRSAKITGGVGIGATLAEIFLLEYAQWPDKNPAWGALMPDDMPLILQTHSQTSNLLYRTPNIAQNRGGLMLYDIAQALGSKEGPRVRILVGHDTNILMLAGLLDLEWDFLDYPANATPPLSGLVFSRIRNMQGSSIHIAAITPALGQFRRKEPERIEPLWQAMAFEQCPTPCSPQAFMHLVQQRIAAQPKIQSIQLDIP